MTTLIRLPQLQQRLPLSSSTIYQMIADGQLPASIPLSRRCVAWPEDEIDQWSVAVAAGATTKQLTALVEHLHEARGILSLIHALPLSYERQANQANDHERTTTSQENVLTRNSDNVQGEPMANDNT